MRGRLRALLTDRRARVPFALIGLALLLLSGTFVFQLDTRETPEPSRETDRAIERTESATETALTDSLTAASEEAARAPLTEPAATQYGEALARGGAPFDRYLKALVYLEAENRLDAAGQEVGAVRTEVSLPEVGDAREFNEAIGRVSISAGSESGELETGVIEAKIAGIETVVRRDNEVIDRRTESVTVAIASPLYQLHSRTNTFQERLDAGITKPGFTQRFNARIYALGWARGYAQYSGLPVTEVIANRHIVPSANDAVYRTQKDVFGAADPNLNNAIRRGWLCMAMHDAEGLYANYADKASDVSTELCDASKWLFGKQATGDVPEPPGVLDLLGEAPGMDAKHTIGVNETSLLPIRDLATSSGSASISQAVSRVYEVSVETALTTTVAETAELEHDRPNGVRKSRVVKRTAEVRNVLVSEITNLEPHDEFQAVEGTVTLEVAEEKNHLRLTEDGRETVTTTATGTEKRDFEITIKERHRSPNAKIDNYNNAGPDGIPITEEYVYGSGPGGRDAATDRTIPLGTDGGRFENYGNPGRRPLYAVFELGATDESAIDEISDEEDDSQKSTVSGQIEQQLTANWKHSQSGENLEFATHETISVPRSSQNALRAAIIYDLEQIQREVSTITHTFKRSEILHNGSEIGPYGELRENLQERKATYLEREQPFASAGQKAMYEARYAYFNALERYLDRTESAHASAMSEIDEQLPDTGLNQAMKFLQQGVTATPPDPVPLGSSSLTAAVSYEVSGSPTYLVTGNVTSETVPAIDNGEQFAPMAAKNRNYLKLPYDTVINGLLSRIGNALKLSEPDAELTFQMASEALVASEESIEAAAADPDYGDSRKLRRLHSDLESAVGSSIEEYSDDVAAQIAFNLYPDDVRMSDIDAGEFRSLEDCEGELCFVIPDDCSGNLCKMEDDSAGAAAVGPVTTTVAEAINNYGDTAETADAIASGEINKAITREVMSVDSGLWPDYARGMAYGEWRTVVNSATRHVVQDAAGEHGVTVSDTDTVENLDTEIRQTLEDVSAEIVNERFDAAVNNGSFEIENYDNWVNGTRTPIRVPAGVPVLPVPGYWYATVNAWNIEVKGEYARFEVSANMGTPETATATTYVREDRNVRREIAGSERALGSVEEVDFSGQSLLIVAVPPGKVGVGDRDDEDPECSPTWPVIGDVAAGSIQCGGLLLANSLGVSGSAPHLGGEVP